MTMNKAKYNEFILNECGSDFYVILKAYLLVFA